MVFNSQFGFLPNESLTDAIATYADIVIENRNHRKSRLMLVQIAMSCTFDTLDKRVIIENLIILKLPS